MSIRLKPFGSNNPNAAYISWTPVQLTVQGVNPSGGSKIILKSRSINGSVARVVFLDKSGAVPTDELEIDLETERQKNVLVAGKFQPGQRHNGASPEGKDVVIEAYWADSPDTVAGSVEVMIRVRRNANELTVKARNDFLDALAILNGIGSYPAAGAGKGIYVTDFVGMHVAGAYSIGHGDSHFLPWHRLYLLDLDRLLQEVNPVVSLPYWKFDETAENLFTEDFMGETETIPDNTPFTPGWSDKLAGFSSTNPISGWKIGEVNGIRRAAYFLTKSEPALGRPAEATANPNDSAFKLINEIATLVLGGAENPQMGTRRRGTADGFSEMEGTPHGAAHVSFNGPINAVPDAPQDPLFFLLHCNVDRLWALWQFVFNRFAIRQSHSYPYQAKLEITGQANGLISGAFPDYWKVLDTPQWPWDSGLSKPGHLRPPGTRSGSFTSSISAVKGLRGAPPTLADTIDAFGVEGLSNYLGFAYDDVPYPFDQKVDQFGSLSTAAPDNQVVTISEYRKGYIERINSADDEEKSMDAKTRRILEIARDSREVDNLIAIVNDPTSEADDKVVAIDTLNNVSNFSPEVLSRMPEIINALRGMMTSSHEELRIRALATLAMMKDEVAQELLREELESETEEQERLVPTSMAISMLGKDEKALSSKLLAKIAAHPPTPESREEAVRHMSADSDSFNVLKDIMEDDSNPLKVRAMIPEMINNVDSDAFAKSATEQLDSKGTDYDLAPFLAKGIATVLNPSEEIDKAKANILNLIENASDSFKTIANKFLSRDNDSSNE